ncbi:Pr6Pr family membrane protein [Paenarthrobacter sp. PH39-S1]|uniref:Pr6Pr family membrane protein n=1 Tax=Paenarthrobacter sp. PH39-S1 TaxID=3046204 RepID=UPI0024BAA070|nr:Pr6Pr family membrane protein [Paenarthrobacter sp. PH39-S1]MDJ0357960.1 Pr6Pr family membrane protein [Paenarthrobacter sp. PH39-S1]
MTPNRGLALFRFWFALLGFLAVLFQLTHLLQNVPGASAGNFFSYFTIESNIIAFITLAIAGRYAWKGESPRWLELLRGAATIYMTITGIVYNLLLSNIDVNTPIPWINVVLHYTIPTIMVIDWLVDLPKTRVPVRTSLIWLAFPLLYLIYSLVRGPIVNWYPYPFLDPRVSGYGTVAVMSLVIAAAAFLFALIVAFSTRLHIAPTPAGVTGTTAAPPQPDAGTIN